MDKPAAEQLRDPNYVHMKILRGEIALTKAQAIHIAGLPADVEERLKPAASPVAGVSADDTEKRFPLPDAEMLAKQARIEEAMGIPLERAAKTWAANEWNIRASQFPYENNFEMAYRTALSLAEDLYLTLRKLAQPSAEGDGELPENLVEGIEWWKDGENPAAFTESGLRDFINDLIKHVSVGKGAEGDGWIAVEKVAHYIESESECLMPIVVGETKHAYGVRLLKVLANELREKFALPAPPSGQGEVK